MVGFSAHPEEAIKGEHLMGDDSYLGERMTFEVRGGKATLDYTQQMDKAGTRETRKAQAEERNCMLEAGDIAGLAEKNIRAWNGTWEPVPEAGNIPGVHIARPTIGNAVKAMRERHFKMGAEVGQMTNKGWKHVQRASVFKQFLLESSYETGALHGVYETLCTLPDEFKSGKWTHERFMKALREAGLDVERELKRDLNVKPNEALAKQKPRAIISSKDEGVVRHIFDAGVLEHVLFENPAFEFRSIKHASPDEVSRRLGELLRNYDFAASMNFGAFDGSCTSEVRNIVENDIIVSMFSKILGTENEKGLLYQAIFDRIKNQANISVKNVLKAVIFDMIRESGDGGTSILNFITNIVLFLAGVSMLLESRGYKVKVIVRILWEILAKGKHANMAAEGDDGLHVFTKAFLEIFDGPKNFGKEWCATYKEYGFKIEPQGNQGEVRPEECLLPTCERVEFCSRIHVATGDYTHSFPKPSKVAQSLSTSFNTAVSRHDACATKAVALMASCMKQPLLFELCATMYETHRRFGGHAIGDVLEKEWSIKEIYNGFVERELDGQWQ